MVPLCHVAQAFEAEYARGKYYLRVGVGSVKRHLINEPSINVFQLWKVIASSLIHFVVVVVSSLHIKSA